MQAAAADGLKGIKGAAVALDPKSGAILAMVSNPTYDPNDLASHDLREVEKNYAALNKDPDKPLLNRTINELYPPGSVFKVVTAAAALSTGEYTENSVLPGPGGARPARAPRPTCPTTTTAPARPAARSR